VNQTASITVSESVLGFAEAAACVAACDA